jgi:hypothetical protein
MEDVVDDSGDLGYRCLLRLCLFLVVVILQVDHTLWLLLQWLRYWGRWLLHGHRNDRFNPSLIHCNKSDGI